MSSSTEYRSDIDGLRALAVLPVVLFHLYAPGFNGGFVGVDIFFVISGFLITRIIVRDIELGRFSVYEFYRRRVLRIFPALFVMLAFTLAVALWADLPSELADFGKSVVATALFSSNMLFYSQAGYFGPAAHELPLLHTWSLAVEEQFYIVWPLLLILFARGRRPGLLWACTLALAVVSFVGAAWWLPRDSEGTFYMAHTRAWELLAGALIAIRPVAVLRHRAARESVALLALLAVLYSIHFYNDAMPFPGPAALLPVLGAAALIAAGDQGGTLVGRALSARPVVFVGKISFSLYLWHWPLIIFSKTALYLDHTKSIKIALLLLSIVLATLSWRYVETPFRSGLKAVRTRRVLASACGVLASFCLVGTVFSASQGLPFRFNAQEQALGAYLNYDGDSRYRGGSCFIVDGRRDHLSDACLTRTAGRPALLLLGDSHAAHLWPGLSALDPKFSTLQANAVGCRPVLPADAHADGTCQAQLRRMLVEWLPAHPVDTVLLAGNWQASDVADLDATVRQILPYAQRVVVVGPVPKYVSALPRVLVHFGLSDAQHQSMHGLQAEPFKLDASLRVAARDSHAVYFSMLDALCDQGHCRSWARDGVPLQFDYGHFTAEGSAIAVQALADALFAPSNSMTP